VIGITNEPLPPQVRACVIDSEPLVLAVCPDHSLARQASVTFDRLRDCTLVTLTRGSGLRTVLDNACRQARFTPRIVAETSELGSLIQLAAVGIGVALLPRSAVAADDPRVATLELTRPRLHRRTALAWNDTTISPTGREFRAIVDRHVPHPR
jgi:DNA-binding transcriptional LysR family regulator